MFEITPAIKQFIVTRSCPKWCVTDEVHTEGHPDDRVLIHCAAPRVVQDESRTLAYEVHVKRYDWMDGAPERAEILLDGELFGPAAARDLGMALLAAAADVDS